MASSTNNNIISDEDCHQILANYLHRKDWSLSSYQVDSLSENVEGMLGEHYIITIAYATPDREQTSQRFFLKILNGSSAFIFEMSQDINAYEKEEFFYKTLLPAMHDYGCDISFAPKYFLCRPFLIVLEDMGSYKFRTLEKSLPFDMDHCKVALRTLAKFHAGSIAYEVKRRKEEEDGVFYLNEVYPKLLQDKLFSNEENFATKWLNNSVEGVMAIVDMQPEMMDGISRTEFSERLSEFVANVAELVAPSRSDLNAVLHGDLWSNNIMFRYEDDAKPVESVLIDFQILKYGVPASDVMQMISSNTRQAFRQEHESTLLDYYHGELMAALKQNQIPNPEDLLSLETFRSTCAAAAIPCKMHAIVDRSTTFIFDTVIGPLLGAHDDAGLRELMMEKMGANIVETYQQNAAFREMIDEDMQELRLLLCRPR